jgi:2-iminobutanoate/2-iminopropanoate deaminase
MMLPKQPRRYLKLQTSTTGAPFSDAVQVDKTLYIAGQIGVDPQTGEIPSDLQKEIEFLFDRIESILGEAKMSLMNITLLQVSCSDAALYEVFNAVYSRRFGTEYPARSFIVAGLVKNARFHASAIAVE